MHLFGITSRSYFLFAASAVSLSKKNKHENKNTNETRHFKKNHFPIISGKIRTFSSFFFDCRVLTTIVVIIIIMIAILIDIGWNDTKKIRAQCVQNFGRILAMWRLFPRACPTCYLMTRATHGLSQDCDEFPFEPTTLSREQPEPCSSFLVRKAYVRSYG